MERKHRRWIAARELQAPVVPVRQETDYTCGAAVVRSIARTWRRRALDEVDVVAHMRMTVDGSDPAHLVRALRRYGIASIPRRPMSDAELRSWLDHRVPVIAMLQAHADARQPHYPTRWLDGHWVVVVGYDGAGVLLMDPLVDGWAALSWRDLAARWHDLEGRTRRRVVRFGLAITSGRIRTTCRD